MKAAKTDTWQKSKECASQAEKVMAEWPQRTGSTPSDWHNHYSPKYDKCFVEVYFLAQQVAGGLVSSTVLHDAFERGSPVALWLKPLCAGACSEEIESFVKVTPCSIEGKPADCAKTDNFISEHMKN